MKTVLDSTGKLLPPQIFMTSDFSQAGEQAKDLQTTAELFPLGAVPEAGSGPGGATAPPLAPFRRGREQWGEAGAAALPLQAAPRASPAAPGPPQPASHLPEKLVNTLIHSRSRGIVPRFRSRIAPTALAPATSVGLKWRGWAPALLPSPGKLSAWLHRRTSVPGL